MSEPRLGFVGPDALEAFGWSPATHLGEGALARRAGLGQPTVAELGGKVFGGVRDEIAERRTSTSGTGPIPMYRQSNIGRLRFHLAPEHWSVPQVTEKRCVQPGDVVLNKLPLFRAALASQAVRRHPADGLSALVVRGLRWTNATWLAICLNQPEYHELLVTQSRSGRSIPVHALKNLRLPAVPAEIEALGAKLHELLDEITLAEERFAHLRAEAEQAAALPVPAGNLRHGRFVSVKELSNVTWSPLAVDLQPQQRQLREEHGWLPVGELAYLQNRDRARVDRDNSRTIHLDDVSYDLSVGQGQPSERTQRAMSRTLGTPLSPGDVLLSTLGSDFRVGYVDEGIPSELLLADSWANVRFRETPAAWALLLSTVSARTQAASLVIGNAQQFVPPEALLSIQLPAVERETRDRWQKAVESYAALRRVREQRWIILEEEITRAFHRAHQLPARGPLPRAIQAAHATAPVYSHETEVPELLGSPSEPAGVPKSDSPGESGP